MKNKFYLLFAGFKKKLFANRLKRSDEVVYNLVQKTMENFWGELVENWWRRTSF